MSVDSGPVSRLIPGARGRVLQVLVRFPDERFSIRQLAAADVSATHAGRVLAELVVIGMVKEYVGFGRPRYGLESRHAASAPLMRLDAGHCPDSERHSA